MYPGLLIWNLQIRRKIKLIIALLMGLGIIATVFAIGKIIDFGIMGARSHAYLGNLFHVIEMWVLLIASSAAPLWPLLKQRGKEKSKVEEEP
ncbi:hypothetical protein N7478_008834 [Penicillium angulare]|uniref:uncharacterized protein n=1 Tax=Penicillium angulare TaxID=116970 RepID=UPI002541FB70|nr:uncharacterized protein N7478_008834 [Penicillium angulare]KAJ5273709.1 hypothetical protein N7478_008834 [Penicillium angulare]